MAKKSKVLFLCTGNSCRSQMAEGWARHLKSGVIEAYSAGIEKHGLDPRAVKVMAEAGVDISGQRSKRVDELDRLDFDYVVTVCASANEHCPYFPGRARLVHVGFDDPPRLARAAPQSASRASRRVVVVALCASSTEQMASLRISPRCSITTFRMWNTTV